jgi:hypothetical protein
VVRWGWIALLGGLVVAALLLAWVDSTIFRTLFPEPVITRKIVVRPAPLPVFPPGGERELPLFRGFGEVGGLYSFWWFLTTAGGAVLVTLAPLVGVPRRVRRAAQRLSRRTVSLMFVAGIASVLLALAATGVLRISFFLLSLVPVVWALAALGVVFGLASLGLALGHWLRERVGPAHPLLAAAAGILVLLDVALVPVAGWLVIAAVAVTALGLAVLTRLGSTAGWSLEELNW